MVKYRTKMYCSYCERITGWTANITQEPLKCLPCHKRAVGALKPRAIGGDRVYADRTVEELQGRYKEWIQSRRWVR